MVSESRLKQRRGFQIQLSLLIPKSLGLPPNERACILLKDVFDYSLEEIAELVDPTIGGVKAALNRAEQSCPLLPLHQIPIEAQTRNWRE